MLIIPMLYNFLYLTNERKGRKEIERGYSLLDNKIKSLYLKKNLKVNWKIWKKYKAKFKLKIWEGKFADTPELNYLNKTLVKVSPLPIMTTINIV